MSDECLQRYLTDPSVTERMRLSAAIRKGKPLISFESDNSFRLCALGCAWAGIKGH